MKKKETAMDKKELGKKGENSAASFLCGKGFTIVGRNVRCGHLETDIIAKNERNIVFAEVKTRREYPQSHSPFGRPSSAVDERKRKNLIAAAEAFLRENREKVHGLIPRIDVIEVYISPNTKDYKVLKILHMENAVGK